MSIGPVKEKLPKKVATKSEQDHMQEKSQHNTIKDEI